MKTLEDIKSGTKLTFELGATDYIFSKTENGETVVFSPTVLADETLKIPISWYVHDIFRNYSKVQGKVLKLTRTKYPWGRITTYRVIVDKRALYDQTKLQTLADSQEFNERRFAFFRYDVVNKLLNRKTKGPLKEMSGLFRGVK